MSQTLFGLGHICSRQRTPFTPRQLRLFFTTRGRTPSRGTRGRKPWQTEASLDVPEFHAVTAQLLERMKPLEARIKLESNNSSKPPTSNARTA